MAEYHVDVSAPGNEYQAYADTPATWAVPQDGNGKAGSGHAAAVPVAEVTFAAVPTSGTISVYGANVTLTGVLSAASTAAAATALASSINATTTALGSGVSALLLPLNRFVFARVKPAEASTVQIMSRFAGADLNFPANAAARVVNTFNNAAVTSPVDFTGGSDGPWAYLTNAATIFGKTIFNYGLFYAASPTPAEPGVDDVIHVRTRRNGVNLSFQGPPAGSVTLTWRARTYLYDDGTRWAGDNGQLTYEFIYSGGSSVAIVCVATNNAITSHVSNGTANLRILLASTAAAGATLTLFGVNAGTANCGAAFLRSVVEERADNLTQGITVMGDQGTVNSMYGDFTGSEFIFRGRVKKVLNIVSGSGSQTGLYAVRQILNGAKVTVVAATQAIEAFLTVSSAAAEVFLEWNGGSVSDTNNVYSCANPLAVGTPKFVGLIDNVSGITNPAVGFTPALNTRSQFVWNQAEGVNRGFRFETPQYMTDWRGDGTFPYTTAADLRGVNWAHRITWNSGSTRNHSVTPVRLAKFSRAAAAPRTVRLDLYVPDSTTFYLDEVEFEVSYVDSSDVLRREKIGTGRSNQLAAGRTALSAGTATWTPNGLAAHSAKKLELTTAFAVKQGSEVVARLSLCTARGTPLAFYFSPELVFA